MTETFRPRTFDEFTGQPHIVQVLRTRVNAARIRGEMPDHILLSGPPGLGKTTLAEVVANELGANFVRIAGPSLESKQDLTAILIRVAPRTVLFVDEIHAVKREVLEVAYTAMEDGRIDVIVNQGTNRAVSVTADLAPFTMVAATTHTGDLPLPVVDRFGGFHGTFELYSDEDLTKVVLRDAELLGFSLTADAATVIASRSRGTPRVAKKLLTYVRDAADANGTTAADATLAAAALDEFGVDARGLDRAARNALRTLCVAFAGGPAGIEAIANTSGVPVEALTKMYEPSMMRQGLIVSAGTRGRRATPLAYAHLGLPLPAGAGQPDLFTTPPTEQR